MNGRLEMRIGGAMTLAACALLVACGGGGGGGGGGVTPQATSTPTPTAMPAPTSQSASMTLSTTSSTQFSFGPVSNSAGTTVVTSATFSVPQVGVASATGNMTMTASVPSGQPTPAARTVHFKVANALGVATTPIVYFTLAVSKSVTVSTSPAVTLTGVGASQPCYLVVYDENNPSAGWNGISGPFTVAGSTLTISSTTLPSAFTLQTGDTYIFAVVTSGSTVPTPTPIASATMQAGNDAPMPAITAIPGVPGAGWTPYQVASALQFPVINGYSGVGQAIVIVGDATPNPTDVSTYLSNVGLSTRAGGALKTVNILGGVNGSGNTNGDDGEATLDVETALSMAPGAIVEFYAMPDLTETSFLAAEQQVLTDSYHPAALSESFGGCESPSNLQDHNLFVQGVGQGISYTASSGDQGNECYTGGTPQYSPGPNNPASDPYVVGVGGNENANRLLNGLGSLVSQAVWNDTYLSGAGASGGGVSTLFPTLPSYQSGIAGLASTSARNVPDISMPAEGVAIFYQGSWSQFGGTSWGAPQAAALIAELNEYCRGTPSNGVAAFYTAFTRSSGAAFIDITTGNNRFGTSSPYYTATTGYDNASGLGLPLGAAVATRMCPSRTWSYGVHAEALTRQTYGEARDTEIANAVNVRAMTDLGARNGSASTSVTIVMRNTASVAQDEQTVTGALQAAGFRITRTYASHLLIEASAPAAVVGGYFRTTVHDVYQGRYGNRYANVTPMTVPAAIAPYVNGVVADNVVTRHRLSYRIR